jgi:hypothetical protein
MKLFSLLMAVAFLLIGCTNDSPLNNPVSATTQVDKLTDETPIAYQYVGYARDGSVIVRGNLMLVVSAAGRVAGRWQLRAVGDPSRIGPQVGTGNLTGTLQDGILAVNLNPQNVDNNVLLNGRFNRTEYTGRWQWITFAGIANGGTFRATRSRTELAEVQD